MSTAPFRLRAIDHVVLRIRDLNASLHFYCDILGCSLDKVQEAVGLWQVRAGVSLIDLVPLDGMLGKRGGAAPGAGARNLDHFAIQVTPFDEDKFAPISPRMGSRSSSPPALRRARRGSVGLYPGSGWQHGGLKGPPAAA